MGQYYQPLLIDGKKTMTAKPWDFDCGAKLMETAWIGNEYINAVLSHLYNHPMHVAWVGDYSLDVDGPFKLGGGFVKSPEEFKKFYDTIWGAGEDVRDVQFVSTETNRCGLDVDNPNSFLVNQTKGIYIDLEKYVAQEEGKKWVINPLPILTCIGNGMGGGDYHGLNMDDVGTWAFDLIYITSIRPSDVEEKAYHFAEWEDLLF